ncbi:MAG: aspartate 1-decarboxylase [Hydrogenophaga sp.]|nr:aspartate 1-decarboxylase [Hydrogenophaga sp.]
MLKSMIQGVSVAHCELYYQGSFAIDHDLPEAAEIPEN